MDDRQNDSDDRKLSRFSKKFEEEQWNSNQANNDSNAHMTEWMSLEQALPHLPHAPGLFRLGYCKYAPFCHTEVVLICHTTHKRTLSEVVTSMSFGFEGGERLMMFMVNPDNKHHVYIKWRVSVYPEDIIEEEMEEYISEEAKVPRYNEPIRVEEEGVWAVVADDPSHPSNNIHRTTPEANDDPQLVHTEIGDQNAFCCSGCCYDNEDNDNLYMLPVSANTSNTQTTASIQPNANSEGGQRPRHNKGSRNVTLSPSAICGHPSQRRHSRRILPVKKSKPLMTYDPMGSDISSSPLGHSKHQQQLKYEIVDIS
ncbi:uncharacterized protein LOC142353729 isoform X2 [Convolutriloba macropyga]|uniref:uncharacterized protein LOC142353729 isoform X2 n=1 Tax=Convolutriloba macropyga TaxID=536237 RepID=UPI003F526AC7